MQRPVAKTLPIQSWTADLVLFSRVGGNWIRQSSFGKLNLDRQYSGLNSTLAIFPDTSCTLRTGLVGRNAEFSERTLSGMKEKTSSPSIVKRLDPWYPAGCRRCSRPICQESLQISGDCPSWQNSTSIMFDVHNTAEFGEIKAVGCCKQRVPLHDDFPRGEVL